MTEEEGVQAFRLHWPCIKDATYENVRKRMRLRTEEDVPVSVVVPWVYEGRPGTLCMVGKKVCDLQGGDWHENVWMIFQRRSQPFLQIIVSNLSGAIQYDTNPFHE